MPFPGAADLFLKKDDPFPKGFPVPGDIGDPRSAVPEELGRPHFFQRIEGGADIPQGIEPLPVDGKRLKLCLCNAQLTFERLEFPPSLPDPRVQRLQFL